MADKELTDLYEQRISQLEKQIETLLKQATSPWLAEQAAEFGDDPDATAWLEEAAKYDVESAICAMRRLYALARDAGWNEVAAMRIAMKNVRDILDAADRPKLSVVKPEKDE
ncbi:MAG: hypothetical protein JO254_04745 [Pseudolabrys sp.]|nr:hypothetical protein [Pseudolabrys sp.]